MPSPSKLIKAINALTPPKKLAAPAVVVPGKLTELERLIRDREGPLGAARVQRAADSIPGLEHQYTLEALRSAFTGDNARALMIGEPGAFQNYATPLTEPFHPAVEQYLRDMAPGGAGARDVPYLSLNRAPRSEEVYVSGHEGRHRNIAMDQLGYPSTLWRMEPRAALREHLPRYSQGEYLDALKKELGEPVYVRPQEGQSEGPSRPLIKLPEMFADGGAVDRQTMLDEFKALGAPPADTRIRTSTRSEHERAFDERRAAEQEARERVFKELPERFARSLPGALGALAGYAAQGPGLPGDIVNLYDEFRPKSWPPAPAALSALPTTERLQEFYLPEDASPEFRAGITGGNIAALGQAAAALPGLAASVARGVPRVARSLVEEGFSPRVGRRAQEGAVKFKGGNWLAGDVEQRLAGLKPGRHAGGEKEMYEAELADLMQDAARTPGLHAARIAELQSRIGETDRDIGLNDWIDKQLARYVKNEMATPEDPVRQLAERGVLHFEPPNRFLPTKESDAARQAFAAQNNERWGYGESPLAQRWEDLSDKAINPTTAGKLTEGPQAYVYGAFPAEVKDMDAARAYIQRHERAGAEHPGIGEALRKYPLTAEETGPLKDNPWLAKLAPETVVNRMGHYSYTDEVGFDHLIDELRNATNPASGLPRELQLKPESLPKLSVPQAVERVAKINEWRAAQMSKARLDDTFKADLFKEYPEQSMRWIQLNRPGQFASESDAMGHSVRGYEPPEGGGSSRYGLGGWDAIKSGRAKIYSLRDKRGEPHVTIEVGPKDLAQAIGDLPAAERLEIAQKIKDKHFNGAMPGTRDEDRYWALIDQEYKKRYGAPGQRIVQIKGKGNRAPDEKYLPFVQDFVRSGNWSDVGDIHNTGLVSIDRDSDLAARMKAANTPVPKYVTQDELTALLKQYGVKGMKDGGAVKKLPPLSANLDTMRYALAQRHAAGGTVKKIMGVKREVDALKSAGRELIGADRVLPARLPEVFTPPLSPADKAENRIMRTRAYRDLKGGERDDAVAAARAKAEKTGVPLKREALAPLVGDEADILESVIKNKGYKLSSVVPRDVMDYALGQRAQYRREPPTTPGPEASEAEWAKWGEKHGVNMTVTKPESLGISDLTTKREVMIPGGLSGTFTIPDLFWIKGNNINPRSLPDDVHTELMKKFIRTHEVKNPDAVDTFNQLNFAALSPNAPLTQNEFLAARFRLRTPEELTQLAGRYGEPGLRTSLEREAGVSQAGTKGGMGVLGTADLSNQANLARLILQKPEMFRAAPDETLRDVTMRVMNQVRGLGPKTASLGTPWLDLLRANTSAVDLHMITDAYPRLLHDPVVGEAFRARMARQLGTEPTAAAILSQPEQAVREAAINVVGGTDLSRRYRLKTGELNAIPASATPDKLAFEPATFSDFNPFYSRVVDYVDESRGPNPSIELFPEQWRKWDRIRGRIEPHEFAHPDYRKLPRQSFTEMQDALKAHKQAGYTAKSEDPTMGLVDWRRLYYGKADPQLLGPLAGAAGAAAAGAAALQDEIPERKKGGSVRERFKHLEAA